MFPDELEVYNAMKTASIATEDYFYNYGPQQDIDDYVDTSYLECPNNCVRHSFCNLTGIYMTSTKIVDPKIGSSKSHLLELSWPI